MIQPRQSNRKNSNNPPKEQARAANGNGRNEESLDFVQALNTALCYLCWTNIDSNVVETFLRKYPEALLFEGTSDDSARSIVEQRMRRCACTDRRCNDNRIKVLEKIDKGFEGYQRKHMRDLLRGKKSSNVKSEQAVLTLNSTFVFPQLMTSNRYLRGLAIEETSVRSQVLETHVSKVAVEQELYEVRALTAQRTSLATKMVRSLFACGGSRGRHTSIQLSRLELELQMEEMKLSSAQKEHKLLVEAIDRGQRNQFVMLRKAFEGCNRYMCSTQEDERESTEALLTL